jgi:hypothetical protein
LTWKNGGTSYDPAPAHHHTHKPEPSRRRLQVSDAKTLQALKRLGEQLDS